MITKVLCDLKGYDQFYTNIVEGERGNFIRYNIEL